MTSILFLALRYLRFNKIKTTILVFSVAVAVFLPLAVNLLVRDYQRDLLARASATPLVAGAPGSRIDLVLHALYFRGKPAHDLAMGDVDAINNSGLALGLPILNQYTARGVPIVGTSLEYFNFRNLHVAIGAGIARAGDCVLGAAAAETLGLHPGDKLMSDPENVLDLAGSYPINMHVTGILAPTGSADDNAIFVDVKTVWLIMGIMHGHENVTAATNPNVVLNKDAGNVAVSEAVQPYQEVTPENIGLFHVHGDPAAFPVSAIIVVPHDAKSAAILRGRYQDPKATVQLLVPTQIVTETLDLAFRVKRFFDAQALLVGIATALLLALVVLLSLRLRRGEMETMFKLGCARGTIFWLQATEILIVLTMGVALASGLSWITVRQLSFTGTHGGASAPAVVTPSPAAKKRVAVVNYPLQYFTQRIAGDHVQIIFPVPREEDPAFWKPKDTDIQQYQQADLVLLNGADYEKWLPATVLPLTTSVVTSQSFSDRYMKNGEVITHSHGPQGMHSHGLIDFNTWMDPTQAILQAQSIHDELVRLVPDAAKDFDANLAALKSDLTNLDTLLTKASTRLGNKPLLASHPVYHYAARRYGWNMKEVHWEPDEMPTEAEWQKLTAMHAIHPAKLMIWEEDPLPAVADRLRKMGITPIAFETCASAPATGDYLSAMQANAQRLEATLAKLYPDNK
jgi:putative ABC transport system permease protein